MKYKIAPIKVWKNKLPKGIKLTGSDKSIIELLKPKGKL